MKTNHRLLEKYEMVPVKPAFTETKTQQGKTFELQPQSKGAKCCEGCEIEQNNLHCNKFSECTYVRNLDKVWKQV